MAWRYDDRPAHWPAGPWDSEPDKMQWQDEDTGLPCLIVRNSMGALCGYVGVSEGHPLFGLDYSSTEADIEVHGGLTFSDRCRPGSDEGRGICHVPEAGEPDHVWWLGFDCNHSGDESPDSIARGWRSEWFASYKPLAYVQGECRSLAAQLAAMTNSPEAA